MITNGEIEGELKPLELGISLEDCADIVCDAYNAINNPEYFKRGEITVKLPRKTYKKFKKLIKNNCPVYFTNNWRKMHNLPLIRNRGKRK